MKQIKTLGWLVMAAALTTTFAACSNDDNDTPDTPAALAKSVTITVGAGITDDNATRSAITEGSNAGKTTRTLTFTTGDKLFVRANYGSSVTDENGDDLYEHVLRGYLTMVGSPSADSLSASFTGDLEQWDRSYNSTDGYTYSKAGSITVTYTDPLGDAAKTYATLVHNGTTEGTEGDYTDYGWSISYYYNVYNKLTTGDDAVNTLMTKYLDVSSSSEGTGYNKENKSFALNDAGNTPIVNCTINGLTASTTYSVTYVIGDTEDDKIALSPSVTTDASGTAHFAFFGDESASTHALTFKSGSETKTASLGDRSLGQAFKIFNVTRTAN